ncbi:hypothetical protein [Sinanaerobacter sp. ZZT-01]|uniref:hypothetical protein n=1 Tax=Sinanaerobacter sp. ZZT-01 TaxID=3111540 RepID=UPI002D7840A5|nr:hypothetical protein [Sinanaerobacter sp. ZZT-01]WRR92744.1 hypothetical protein U5921_11905 [Sinanaerobacter sp. ZZT-01]
MNVIGLVRAVCERQQQELAEEAIEEKKEFVRSDKFLGKYLIRGMLTSGVLVVEENLIQIITKVGEKKSLAQLNTTIKEGHWVYASYFSVDVYDFSWFSNLNDALKYYLSLAHDNWCGEKHLLFAEKDVVHYIEVKTEGDKKEN